MVLSQQAFWGQGQITRSEQGGENKNESFDHEGVGSTRSALELTGRRVVEREGNIVEGKTQKKKGNGKKY